MKTAQAEKITKRDENRLLTLAFKADAPDEFLIQWGLDTYYDYSSYLLEHSSVYEAVLAIAKDEGWSEFDIDEAGEEELDELVSSTLWHTEDLERFAGLMYITREELVDFIFSQDYKESAAGDAVLVNFEAEFSKYFDIDETEYLVLEEIERLVIECVEEFLEEQRASFAEAVAAGEDCDEALAELQGDFEREHGVTDELIDLIDYDRVLEVIHNFEREFNS